MTNLELGSCDTLEFQLFYPIPRYFDLLEFNLFYFSPMITVYRTVTHSQYKLSVEMRRKECHCMRRSHLLIRQLQKY